LFFVVAAFAATVVDKEEFALKQQFALYVKQFNKLYSNEAETAVRFENFKASLKRIAHKNLMNPKAHYDLSKFSDLSLEEFRATYLMKRTPAAAVVESCLATGIDSRVGQPIKAQALPTKFDWRDTGKVTPVKDQGQCGSSGLSQQLVQLNLPTPSKTKSMQPYNFQNKQLLIVHMHVQMLTDNLFATKDAMVVGCGPPCMTQSLLEVYQQKLITHTLQKMELVQFKEKNCTLLQKTSLVCLDQTNKEHQLMKQH